MSSVASFQAIKEANYSALLTEYIPNFLFCAILFYLLKSSKSDHKCYEFETELRRLKVAAGCEGGK